MQTPSLSEILGNSKKPTFIRGLRIEEISGVDHPAHEVEGWTVMKSRDRARKMGSIGLWNGLEGDYAVVVKSVNKERRYTLGLLYSASNPGAAVADAHGESVSESDLYTASLNYVKSGDRGIHLQHGGTEFGLKRIGEWVHLMQWPNEVTEEFELPSHDHPHQRKVTKVTIPANSVWVGIEWNELGWDLIKQGRLRGLSLGGFRQKKAEETGMAKQEKPIKDPLEGYIYKRFNKAKHDDFPDSQNTPEQPHGSTEVPGGPASQFKFPQVDPKLIDHKPRMDLRFEEYLRGLGDGMETDRYRRMLEIIGEFNDRTLQVTDQAGHIANLKQLATDLRKIMFNDHDVVSILRMGRYILPEAGVGNWDGNEDPKILPHGLGNTIMNQLRRGISQNVLSSFDAKDALEKQKTEQEEADKRTKK